MKKCITVGIDILKIVISGGSLLVLRLQIASFNSAGLSP